MGGKVLELKVDKAVEQAVEQALKNLLITMLKKGVSVTDVSAMTNTPEEYVKKLKEVLDAIERGAQAVCEVMEKYEKIAVNKERISAIQKMLKKRYSKEQILELDYTEEEYFQAKEGKEQ